MARRPRRNHSSAFKAKVAGGAIEGEKTLIALAQGFDVHPNRIKQWRDQLLEGTTGVCGDGPKADTVLHPLRKQRRPPPSAPLMSPTMPTAAAALPRADLIGDFTTPRAMPDILRSRADPDNHHRARGRDGYG